MGCRGRQFEFIIYFNNVLNMGCVGANMSLLITLIMLSMGANLISGCYFLAFSITNCIILTTQSPAHLIICLNSATAINNKIAMTVLAARVGFHRCSVAMTAKYQGEMYGGPSFMRNSQDLR